MITYTCTSCENKVVAKHNLKVKCSCGNTMYDKHGIIDSGRTPPKTKRNKGFPYRKSSGKDKVRHNYINPNKTQGRRVSDDFKHKGGDD